MSGVQPYLAQLLRDLDLKPVLMDVGASGAPPPIWADIAPHSIYIGFDPDLREIHEDKVAGYHHSVILNEAVTSQADSQEVRFYLTRSPFCSTTLDPNPAATAPWLEQDLFDVEGCATVRATTIDSALTRLNMSRIDWIKLDTQGTDLRILKSISPDVFSRVMAVDTEPGLIRIYQGEDMFVDIHRELTEKGFWLSGMHTGGFLRMRRATLDALRRSNADIDDTYVREAVRTSPAYIEARYLRTIECLAEHETSEHEYMLLWIFALTDLQLGFALDLSIEYERKFGATAASRKLTEVTWAFINRSHRRRALKSAYAPVARRMKSVLGRLVD
jgi:FkbM family methyltransferase